MAEYIKRTEELMLAMNAGARAIENTKRYHGAVYTKDVFSEASQEIPYLLAAKVLREVSDTPAADVAPVRHGQWIEYTKVIIPEPYNKWEQAWKCSECGFDDGFVAYNYCPNCGAKMDGGGGDAAD